MDTAPDRPTLRLLVVDDDAVDRMVVTRGLRSAGVEAECVEVRDGRTVLELLARETFHCVFLDFNLPDATGLEVLRRIREAGYRTPVVMLTGQGDEELAVRLMKAGASDYIPKGGVSGERLAQSLRTVLRVHEAESRVREAEAAREAALAARSRFYAAMSHELRTPINAILGYNDLLLASVYGALSPKQAEGLEGAQRAARHLLELVNDVLDLSKIEAGKMDLVMEEVDVAALLEDLLATVRPLAAEHGSALSCDFEPDLPRILTDPRRLRQILLNLLSNAIKYGQGGPVTVRCSATDAGGVRSEVVDRGKGIAAEDLPRIFEDFVQLDQASKGGTGLGLAISKRLADLLGGRLEAESELGVGSTFRLDLPAAARPRVGARSDLSAAASSP